ncbi:hypothetical protein HDU97_006877 [Phlyctochytrium planicorne]|nr:hypothetical protein HDU97_006877 [Phlyctochytrium planicorne]
MGFLRFQPLLLLLWWTHRSAAYHLGDDENHCWIATKLSTCPPGFDLLWIQKPPESITANVPFNATYSVVAGSVVPFGQSLIAHANLHACPQDIGFCDVNVKNGTASASGAIVTQELAQVSNKTVIFSNLRLAAGQWTIVAHLRVFFLTDPADPNTKTQLDVARAVYRTAKRSVCNPGTARVGADANGEPLCSVCPMGAFTNSTDAPACLSCPPGTYQPDPGKTFCMKCQDGYFQDRPGQGSCLPCPGFTYADSTGSKCLTCPAGSFTMGFYSSGTNGTCSVCPETGVCCKCSEDPMHSWETILSNIKNRLPACNTCRNGTDLPVAKPGHFPSSESKSVFYTCEPEESCEGGTDPSRLCATGYEDDRCGKCSVGYYQSYRGNCEACDGSGISGILLFAFILVLAGIVVGTLVLVLAEECSDSGAVLVVMFQVFDLCRRYKAVWPSATSSILYAAALFNLDLTFFRLDCFLQISYLTQQYIWLVSPLLLALALYIIAGVLYVVRQLRPQWKLETPIAWGPDKPYPFDIRRPFKKIFEVPDNEFWRICNSWIIFCLFPMYTIITSRTFLPFNCGEVAVLEDGTSVKYLKERKESPEFYQTFWPIYYPFTQTNTSWMAMKLTMVLCFHATHVIFKSDALQMTGGALVLLLELVVIAWRRPWVEPFVTYVHFLALSGVVTFLVFAKDTTNGTENYSKYDPIMTICLLFTIVGILFMLGYAQIATFLPKKFQIAGMNHRPTILTKSANSLHGHEHVPNDEPEEDLKHLKMESVRNSEIQKSSEYH